MSRRVVAPRFEAPVEIVEVDALVPAAGRVVVAVRAAGVNPSDAKSIAGFFGRDPASLPLRPGSEVAGIVTAVGPEVEHLAVGDEVIVFRAIGGFADEIVAKAGNVFPKPRSLSFEEAAALMVTGTTAWHLLEATGVGEGDTVIVHGASGSVGLAATQLAVLRGARVIGTASERNAELLRSVGATPVVYGEGLTERLRDVLPGGADVALDAAGTDEAIDASLDLVADRSRIATVVAFQRGAEAGILRLGGGAGADPGTAIRDAARAPLIELAARGALRLRVARSFPLDEAGDAIALAASGHPGGKVVLAP